MLGRLGEFFLSKKEKALLDIDSKVDTTSVKANEGSIDKIVAKKNSSIKVDNSRHIHNHFHLTVPDNFDINSPEFSQVQQKLMDEFNNKGVQFVSQQSEATIIGYKDYEANSPYVEVANFFQDKISVADLQLLRTGLYVRYLSENNEKQKALQIKDTAKRNNARARNIINLASAGYFEGYIRPIYENNTLEVFKDEYEEVVKYMPEIIFVNSNMTVDDILAEVDAKIEQSQQYHLQVRRITVNGLNQTVDIIRESEPLLREVYPAYKIKLNIDGSKDALLQCKMRVELPE